MQLTKYLEYNNPSDKTKKWINTHLLAHLKTNPEDQSEVEHILDFLASDKAPRRITRLGYKAAKTEALKWVKRMNKRGEHILESDKDLKTFIDFKDGFKLVKLVGENAFKREGLLMSHCVASYYNKEGVSIYSLRDGANMPHCTIEVVGEDNIQQIKGKGNGSIHPDYITYILKSLTKLGVTVRESEMANLGYDLLDGEFLKWIKSNFSGVQIKRIKGKMYFYKQSVLVRKSA